MRVWVVVVLVLAVGVAPVRASMTLSDMRAVESALFDGWGWSMAAGQPELAADFAAVYVEVRQIDPWSPNSSQQLRAAVVGP